MMLSHSLLHGTLPMLLDRSVGQIPISSFVIAWLIIISDLGHVYIEAEYTVPQYDVCIYKCHPLPVS